MRRALLAAATAALLAGPGAAPAEGASPLTASSRINGEVAERDGSTVFDSFSLGSETVGRPDLSGSADDPGGTARSSADVTFQAATVTGGERLTAQGSTSARSGLPVRQSQSTSHVLAEFTLTEPAGYSAAGSVSERSPAGHCCAGASVRLTDDDGDNVVSTFVNSGGGSKGVASSGTLAPGSYRFTVEASVGFGFGAAASDISGTAAFDVSLTLTLPGADADGDALPDSWETDGVDVDGNGTVDLDLPGMGADPRHKDVFAEVDFMPPHRPAVQASSLVADAFADAPVANPDGEPGIALHLDNGSDSVMNPKTGATWGSRSRQNSLVHQNVLGSVVGDEYDWGAFDALRSTSFEAARRTAFHYAISAHGHDGTGSGLARGIPSADLLVTLGAGCATLNGGADCTLGPMAQAGTLMHELGHNLGLHHGGGDELGFKPNYLSVMNYAFQITGLQEVSGDRFLDYSRFGIPMNETALDEGRGLGVSSGPAADLITVGICPGDLMVTWPVKESPVDLDCSGNVTGAVAADVNGDGSKSALPGFIDWTALVFAGGGIGGSGATVPARTASDEPPLDVLLAAQAALDAAVPVAPVPPTPTPGPGPGAGPAPAGGTSDVALAVTALAVRPGAFRARRGARVTYTLTAPARVRFTVERLLGGHRRGGRCRPAGRGPRCVRAVTVRGSFTQAGKAGANTVRLPARLGGKRLKPGRYRLTATPFGGIARRADFRVR